MAVWCWWMSGVGGWHMVTSWCGWEAVCRVVVEQWWLGGGVTDGDMKWVGGRWWTLLGDEYANVG